MEILRPVGSGLISVWNSGDFAFDARGNITAIGAQTFGCKTIVRLCQIRILLRSCWTQWRQCSLALIVRQSNSRKPREVKKLSRAANNCDGVSCRGHGYRSVRLLTSSQRSRMLSFITAHPEEHEALISAMAFAAPDPCRLDQPQTARRRRVPPDGESSPPREAGKETNPAQRRPAPAPGCQRQDPRAEEARAAGHHRDSGYDSPVASRAGRQALGL